jgi:prepilin-type N-terminal cleavage/methylation domain-containing protein
VRKRERQAGPRSSRAFTLVEIITSLAISSILLLALVSAVLLASKALPASSAAVDSRDAATTAIDIMMSELATAKNVVSASTTDVRFTVPDRTGDGADDTIEYQWSGTPGAPLQRNFNDAAWTNVSPPLKAFALSYGKRSSTSSVVTMQNVTSPETPLWLWNGWSGVTLLNVAMNLSGSAWVSQSFPVTCPDTNINRLEITRVRLKLSKLAAAGSVSVGVYNTSSLGSGLPLGVPIGSLCTVPSASLPGSAAWVDFPMSGVVLPDCSMSELVVQIKATNATGVASLAYYTAVISLSSGPVMRWTSNGGVNWLIDLGVLKSTAPMEVYCTYQKPVSVTSNVTTYSLGRVTASATTSDTGARIDAGMQALNEPGVPGP